MGFMLQAVQSLELGGEGRGGLSNSRNSWVVEQLPEDVVEFLNLASRRSWMNFCWGWLGSEESIMYML